MDRQILIFSTSISTRQDVKRVGKLLGACGRIKKWNVDFDDWEKVLRIEFEGIETDEIDHSLI